MGIVIALGLIGLLVVSAALSYVSHFSFWWWLIGILSALICIWTALKWLDHLKVVSGDSGLPIKRIDKPNVDIPLWSRSSESLTHNIKISQDQPFRLLDPEPAFDEAGDHGVQIVYPNSTHPDQFFIMHGKVADNAGYSIELLNWNKSLSNRAVANSILPSRKITGATLFGLSHSMTLFSAQFSHHAERQLFLFDHHKQSALPITELKSVASASIGWTGNSHYFIASQTDSDSFLVVTYEKAKNFDDFFSARGRYIPRVSQLTLHSEKNPKGELLSRMILEKHGLIIGVLPVKSEIFIQTLDERNLEAPLTRYWSLSLTDLEMSD